MSFWPKLLTVLAVFISLSIYPDSCLGDERYPTGARSWGMAQAVVAQSDHFSIFSNIAGIASIRKTGLISSYDSFYGYEGLGTFAAAAVLPVTADFSTGLSVQRFGDKLYNQLALGGGVAHRVNWMKLGLKISYVQVAINTPSLTISQKALTIEAGGIARLSSQVSIGVHFYNLAQGHFSGETRERLPTVLKAGISYAPSPSFLLNMDAVKDTGYPVSLKIGLEYQPVSHLFLRSGFSSVSRTTHFGTGWESSRFRVDYAAHSHLQLGWSHHIGLVFFVKKSSIEKSAD